MFAISQAKELAPESYSVLYEPEPRENNPAHSSRGSKINNATHVIEDKLDTFLLEAKAAKAGMQEEPAASEQRKMYEQQVRQKPTIKRVK